MAYLSAFSDEVHDDIHEQIKFLNEEQIKFAELRFINKKNIIDLTNNELQELKNLMDDHGIKCSAIGSPIGKVRLDESFDEHLDKFKRTVEIANLLKAPFIRIFSYYPPVGRKIDDYRLEVVDRMCKKVEQVKGSTVILVHENESGIYGYNAENCIDLARTINSPYWKLAYDPGNFVWGQNISDNMNRCWPLMKPYVVHIHIKDWKIGSKDVGCLPGRGDGQIFELLAELWHINYHGFLTLEPHLNLGGQFGGMTSPELFHQVIIEIKKMADLTGLTIN